MLSRIRLFVAVGVVCGLAPFLHAQSSNRAVWPLPETYLPGLKTLLESAVRQSPQMIARNTEEAVAEAERIAARAGQLPSVRGFGNFYPWIQDKRGPETTTTAKTSYNFAAEQPVFHWGALHNTTRIGELRKKIVQGQTAEVYRGLVAEIRGVYLQLVMKRLSLQRARTAQQMADEALGLARKRFEQKVISEADLFGPTIAAEQARLTADRLEEDLNNSLVFVGKLCGVPALSMAELPTAIPAITPASEALDGIVAEFAGQPEPHTNGLGVLRRQIEIEKLNYRIAAARLRPKMNAVFGLYQDEQNYLVQEGGVDRYRYQQVQSLFAGVTVNWSIFDGFASKAAKTASLARRRQIERDYGSQVENVIANVRGQRRQLDFAMRGLAISEQYLALGGRTLQTREDEQRRGLISTADLSAARLQYLDTQIATFAARNDYLLKVAALLSATQNDPALAGLPEHLR